MMTKVASIKRIASEEEWEAQLPIACWVQVASSATRIEDHYQR